MVIQRRSCTTILADEIMYREATFVASVAELVHDVIPQQTTSAGAKDHERVEWISFQTADINGQQKNLSH